MLSLTSKHVGARRKMPSREEITDYIARIYFGIFLSLAPEHSRVPCQSARAHPRILDTSVVHLPMFHVLYTRTLLPFVGIALQPENCVMALAYIERLIALTNITLYVLS